MALSPETLVAICYPGETGETYQATWAEFVDANPDEDFDAVAAVLAVGGTYQGEGVGGIEYTARLA